MKKNRYVYHFPWVTTGCIVLFVLLLVGAWLWTTTHSWGYGRVWRGVGSAVGIAGYTLFGLSLFLSSRWKKLEDWIGGLDQVYRLHHRIGLWGFYLLLAHPWILALKWLPQRPGRFFLFLFPVHNRLSVDLGSYALWLMLIIILITIFKLLPYDKWKLVHKCMSVVFVVASLHFLLSYRRFNPSFVALIPLFIPMCMGFLGIGYKQVWKPLFFRYSKYVVTDAQRVNDTVMMITFKSQEHPLTFTPGQYAFFSFRENLSREQHPFTICTTQDSSISILAKVRGDFTRSLYQNLKTGTLTLVDGPYGRFDYTRGMKDQIWIAGGIGIAPFLAWCHSFEEWPGKIDLFYCAHREADLLFLHEFQALQGANALFSFHLFCTERKRHLTMQNIADVVGEVNKRDVFMCGPRRLTRHFLGEFQKSGVKRKHIHFEDFEFF